MTVAKALDEVPTPQPPALPDWPEFMGEIKYDVPREQYSWMLSSENYTNTLVCKTEAQAYSIAAYIRERPQCGLAKVSHDFDMQVWRVSQIFSKLRLTENDTVDKQAIAQAPKE